MTQPTNYTPTTDFSQQESINASGRSTVNTAALDAEFANIETTLDQTVSNLSLIQRDDGRLADLSVDVYTLTRQVLNLIGGYALKGAWQPSTSYAEKDIVDNVGVLYLCVASHTSPGSFVEDGNWSRFGFSGGEDAAASAAMAAVSASSADSSEARAILAASEAAASAISAWSARSAAASAQSAAASASGSASTSASNAVNSAAEAALSAASVARPIPIAEGGTGTTTAALAIAALGGVASATFSASSGAAQIGTIQTGSGAVATTQQEINRRTISLFDFLTSAEQSDMRAGTASLDLTVAVQSAINDVQTAGSDYALDLVCGTAMLTAPLTITKPIRIFGSGVSPYEAAIGTRGPGSWLYFNHTGKGIVVDGAAVLSGVELDKFGTYRNQPAPAPGWAPLACDYDIYIDNADVYIPDLMLLNPTKGIFLTNGNAGRLEIGRLRGQAMQTMLRVDQSYDVVKINSLHQWPFWKDDSNVHAYTMANLDTYYSERNDNPMIVDFFSIFARSGIRLAENASGRTSKMKVGNADIDRGKYAVWFDNTNTTGSHIQIANLTSQAETGLAGSISLFVQGTNNDVSIANHRVDLASNEGIRVVGSGNLVRIGNPTINNWNQSAGGYPAIDGSANNAVELGLPLISNGGGLGAKYGLNGLKIFADEYTAFVPAVTAQTGTITTVGTITARYKRTRAGVHYEVNIPITTNGTGAGAVNFTLPVAAAASVHSYIGTGRETSGFGKALQVVILEGTTSAAISNYDNTYPGANGYTLSVSGFYEA